jgi:hypothetical protein
MYNVLLGGDINRGDLVAVANGNDISIGIYFGQGRGGTFQYFHPSSPGRSKEWHDTRANNLKGVQDVKPFKLTNIWKSYVNTPRDTRIIKLNRDNITHPETIKDILEAKEILKEFNIEVNY